MAVKGWQRGRKQRAFGTMCLIAVSGMALAACSSSGGTTASKTSGSKTSGSGTSTQTSTIQVGTWGPKSGPFSVIGQINEGMLAYMNELNKSGTLGKYKVNVSYGNDQYNSSLTPGVVRTLVQQDNVAMMCAGVGTPNNKVVKSYLLSSGVANIAPGDGTPSLFIPANKVEFGLNRPYQPEAAAMAQFAVDNLHQSKIAIAYSNTAVGTPGLKGAEYELSRKGIKPAATIGFAVTSTNFASEAAALKASGATFVIAWTVNPAFSELVNAAAQIGYTPKWGAPFFNMTIAGSLTATHGALTGSSYYVGWIPPLTDPAVVAAAKATLPKAVSNGQVNSLFLQGYIAGYVCGQVLQRAIGLKGGPTKSNIIAAANGLTLGSTSPFAQGLKWTKTSHLANIRERIYSAATGGFKIVTPFEQDPTAPLQ